MNLKIHSLLIATLSLFAVSLFVPPAPVAAQTAPTATPTIPPPSCTTTFPTDKSMVTLSYTVASNAAYNVWSRIQGSGSGLIQIDSECPVVIGGVDEWTWVNYQKGDSSKRLNYALTIGTHTIKYAFEAGVFNIDRVILVDDINCIPANFGQNCDGSPADPNNPGPTYNCIGSCPTIDPNITIVLPQLPGGGGTVPCGGGGGGGLIGLILEFIFKLLELLFGGAICTPTTPAPPVGTPSATLAPASPSAVLQPTATVAATAAPTVGPTVTLTP